MVEGHGCILKDIDGKEYIDGLAGLWLVNVGHGRKEIGEAMAAQAGTLAYASSTQMTTVPAIQLATLLSSLRLAISLPCFLQWGSDGSSRRSRLPDNISISPAFPNVLRLLDGGAPTMGQRMAR